MPQSAVLPLQLCFLAPWNTTCWKSLEPGQFINASQPATPSQQKQQERELEQILNASSHHPEKYLPAMLLTPQQDCPAEFTNHKIPHRKKIQIIFNILLFPMAYIPYRTYKLVTETFISSTENKGFMSLFPSFHYCVRYKKKIYSLIKLLDYPG